MKLEFVNHASFILQEGDVTLMMDPWLEGSVFDNSWSLLMPVNLKNYLLSCGKA
jgi:L-ascorbate metabolism protein UlaG (beta-lactamase superfamily)